VLLEDPDMYSFDQISPKFLQFYEEHAQDTSRTLNLHIFCSLNPNNAIFDALESSVFCDQEHVKFDQPMHN